MAYDHDRCIASYMGHAMGFYRFRHVERSTGMVFKSIGLDPRGRMSSVAARAGWRLMQWRRERFMAALRRAANENAPGLDRAA